MKRSTLHIIIALAAGLLIGFVFGTAFCASDDIVNANGSSAKGNIAELSRLRYQREEVKEEVPSESKDTIRLHATDEKGENWNIIITK